MDIENQIKDIRRVLVSLLEVLESSVPLRADLREWLNEQPEHQHSDGVDDSS